MSKPVRSSEPVSRVRVAGFAAVAVAVLAGPAAAFAQAPGGPQSPTPAAVNQPAPRFASLKADRVNVRRGPGSEHAIEWVFRRAGLPVEVIAASDIWLRVRDSEGSTGWVLASLLSGRRTALIEPWEVKGGADRPQVPLRSADSETAAALAHVEAGVLANVRSCDGRWCLVNVAGYSGYIQQHRVWGVYKGEVVR